MTWRPSKSQRACRGITSGDTVSCFVIHKYGNGKQRLLVAAEPCASFQLIQSRRMHTKERRTGNCALCQSIRRNAAIQKFRAENPDLARQRGRQYRDPKKNVENSKTRRLKNPERH